MDQKPRRHRRRLLTPPKRNQKTPGCGQRLFRTAVRQLRRLAHACRGRLRPAPAPDPDPRPLTSEEILAQKRETAERIAREVSEDSMSRYSWTRITYNRIPSISRLATDSSSSDSWLQPRYVPQATKPPVPQKRKQLPLKTSSALSETHATQITHSSDALCKSDTCAGAPNMVDHNPIKRETPRPTPRSLPSLANDSVAVTSNELSGAVSESSAIKDRKIVLDIPPKPPPWKTECERKNVETSPLGDRQGQDAVTSIASTNTSSGLNVSTGRDERQDRRITQEQQSDETSTLASLSDSSTNCGQQIPAEEDTSSAGTTANVTQGNWNQHQSPVLLESMPRRTKQVCDFAVQTSSLAEEKPLQKTFGLQAVPSSSTTSTQCTKPSLKDRSTQNIYCPPKDKAMQTMCTDDLSMRLMSLISHSMGLSKEQILLHGNSINSRIQEFLTDVHRFADGLDLPSDKKVISKKDNKNTDIDVSSVGIENALSDAINDCSSEEVYLDAEEFPNAERESLQITNMDMINDLEEAMGDTDVLRDSPKMSPGITDALEEAMCDLNDIPLDTSQDTTPATENLGSSKIPVFDEQKVIPLPGLVRLKHTISMPWFILLDHDMSDNEQFNLEVRPTKSLEIISMDQYNFDPDEELKLGAAFRNVTTNKQSEAIDENVCIIKQEISSKGQINQQRQQQSSGVTKVTQGAKISEEAGVVNTDLIDECLLEVHQSDSGEVKSSISYCLDDYLLTSSEESLKNESPQKHTHGFKPITHSDKKGKAVSSEKSEEPFTFVNIYGNTPKTSLDIDLLTSSEEDQHISGKSSRKISSHGKADGAKESYKQHHQISSDSGQPGGKQSSRSSKSYQPETILDDKNVTICKKKSQEKFSNALIDPAQNKPKTNKHTGIPQISNLFTDFERVIMGSEENHLKVIAKTSLESVTPAVTEKSKGQNKVKSSGKCSDTHDQGNSKKDGSDIRKTSQERFGNRNIDADRANPCLHKENQSTKVDNSVKVHPSTSDGDDQVKNTHFSPCLNEENPTHSTKEHNKKKPKVDDSSKSSEPGQKDIPTDEPGPSQSQDVPHVISAGHKHVTFMEGYELPMDAHYGLHDKDNYPLKSLLKRTVENSAESSSQPSTSQGQDDNQLSPLVEETPDSHRPRELPPLVTGLDGVTYPDITAPVIPLTRIEWEKNDQGLHVLLGAGTFGYCEAARYLTPKSVEVQVCIKRCHDIADQLALIREGRFAHYLNETGALPIYHGCMYLCKGCHLLVALVSELFAEGKTLSALLRNHHFLLPDGDWVAICNQLANCLQRIHDHEVILNDVKGNNILVDVNNGGQPVIKFIDLGMASYKCGITLDPEKDGIQQMRHIAPEVKSSGATSKNSDIWALGALYWDIYEKSHVQGLDDVSKAALVTDPSKRPSLRTILQLLEGLTENRQ